MRGLDLTPADFLHLDLFPAEVVCANEGFLGDELRIVVTDNHLYALREEVDGPEMWFKEPLTDFSGTNKSGYTVSTETSTYHVKRAPNCGCGATLRGLRLFPDATYLRPND